MPLMLPRRYKYGLLQRQTAFFFAVYLVVKQILRATGLVVLTKYPAFLYGIALDLEDFLHCLPTT
jgi:hypothetical protein